MRYLVLLYGDESLNPQPGTPEFDADMAGYGAFDELAGAAIVAGEALNENAACRTVRHDGGKVRITDGPFAETVEGLGGVYVLEAPTLDDIIELCRHIPAVNYGAIEMRPMVEWFDRSAASSEAGAGLGPLADGEVRYFATICGPQGPGDVPGTPEWDAGAEAHGKFAAEAGDAVTAGGAVQPPATATTVRVRDGELLVTDGPFAEAMEIVGGFYVLRGTPDAVADVAAKVPVNDGGAVELRPIIEMDDMMGEDG